MKTNLKLALAVVAGVLIGFAGAKAIHAQQAKTPPAYVIAEVEVTDPATLQKYGAKAVGALAISGAQSELSREKKATEQVVREGSFELDTSADKALLFFTPEGERAWVKGWDPKPVYPPQADVAFKTNAVFRVDQEEERSLWTIVEANSPEHIAEYIFVVEGERVSRVRVQIQPLGGKHCRVRVRYVNTATSEKGLSFVASVTEESYAQKMQDWHRILSAAIQ